jgi:hypothetical protein
MSFPSSSSYTMAFFERTKLRVSSESKPFTFKNCINVNQDLDVAALYSDPDAFLRLGTVGVVAHDRWCICHERGQMQVRISACGHAVDLECLTSHVCYTNECPTAGCAELLFDRPRELPADPCVNRHCMET